MMMFFPGDVDDDVHEDVDDDALDHDKNKKTKNSPFCHKKQKMMHHTCDIEKNNLMHHTFDIKTKNMMHHT